MSNRISNSLYSLSTETERAVLGMRWEAQCRLMWVPFLLCAIVLSMAVLC